MQDASASASASTCMYKYKYKYKYKSFDKQANVLSSTLRSNFLKVCERIWKQKVKS